MNRIRRRAASALGLFALLAGALGVVAPAQAAGTHTITVQLNPGQEGYIAEIQCDDEDFDALAGTDASGRAVIAGVPDGATDCEAVGTINIFFAPAVTLYSGGAYMGSTDFVSDSDKTVSVNLEPSSPGSFRCAGASTVNGDAAIGHAVSAGVPAFANGDPDPASIRYIWFRVKFVNAHIVATLVQGGTEASSTSASYTPAAADSGSQLVALVTASKSGGGGSTICDYLPSGAVHQAGTPAPGAAGIQGKGKVGKKLTAVAPPLAGATVQYQWFQVTKKKGKNRLVTKPLKGATGPVYKVKKKNKGKKLFVAVTYTKAPDGPTTVISRSKKIR